MQFSAVPLVDEGMRVALFFGAVHAEIPVEIVMHKRIVISATKDRDDKVIRMVPACPQKPEPFFLRDLFVAGGHGDFLYARIKSVHFVIVNNRRDDVRQREKCDLRRNAEDAGCIKHSRLYADRGGSGIDSTFPAAPVRL